MTVEKLTLALAIVTGIYTVATIAIAIFAYRANVKAMEANASARHANRIAEAANKMAAGGAVISVMSQITTQWQRVHDVKSELAALTEHEAPSKWSAEKKRNIASKKNDFCFAIEQLCNAYEAACGAYLDDACDRERFRKSAYRDIRKLVETDIETIKEVLNPSPTTQYEAIMKVYNEWHRLEE